MAFTEHGVAMLSGVLRSERAVRVNIQVIRAFVRMRNMIIAQHASGDNALECLDCHKSKVDEQVTEASHWASGDYAYPLTKRDFGTRASCLTSGCHDEAKIVSATANWGGASGYNPHNPRHGKLQCGACHSMHGASTLACNSCHSLKLPAGWEQPAKPGTPSN